MIETSSVPRSDASLTGHLITSGTLRLLLCLPAPLIGRWLGLIDDPKAKAHSLHERKMLLGVALLCSFRGDNDGQRRNLLELFSQSGGCVAS